MKKIYIELSDICHLACSFCPAPKASRGIMPLSLFERALDEALPLSKRIALHILGDPCYLDALGSYLALARDRGAQVEIVTSGLFLPKHPPALLLAPPVYQVSISLEAGLDNNIRDYAARIAPFVSAHFANPACFLNLRIQSVSDKDKILALLREILPSEALGALRAELSDTLMQSPRIRLWSKAFLITKPCFTWAGYSRAKSTRKKCHGLIEQLGILSDGRVVPCCIDARGEMTLGDIRTQGLAEILATPRARAIAEGFRQGIAREATCQACGFVGVK
ncbi:hypothetical protein BKN38_01825 [Helicobacter sp. CLO-3]|uniref:radical SAM/SPASM domain-containing protein n=1 Tax=unclassified Helicobacter TaxID=2593540 RepID=UPI0008059DDF|nr:MULTISPECIES: radical SAM/SPASM domain-containing protein [unclassified Helicobacter]OBV28959.1 hypothetical protein BA723_01135 [Helicobacter sp. CLO-3]OHU84804.1 hypothetical protein BKN38_01825 [Helicobacter sp. CLO-3]